MLCFGLSRIVIDNDDVQFVKAIVTKSKFRFVYNKNGACTNLSAAMFPEQNFVLSNPRDFRKSANVLRICQNRSRICQSKLRGREIRPCPLLSCLYRNRLSGVAVPFHAVLLPDGAIV